MNNLARIVSHGFAIVVVILLGIGFIYRGQLFPDLELPDFLVPESDKVAETGNKPAIVQSGREQAEETAADEAAKAQSSVTAAESVPVVPAVPATGAPSEAPGTGTGVETPPSEAPEVNPHETTPNEMAIEPAGETRHPVAEAVPPPAAEESVPGEGAAGDIGEPAASTAGTSVSPGPATSAEPPTEPPAGGTGTEAPAISANTSPEPGTSGETSLQPGSLAPATKPEAYPVAKPLEGTGTPPGGMTPGSSPVTTTNTRPGGTSAGQISRNPAAPEKPYELLAAAREAFWLHNYDDAEKNYHALKELEPENPDGYGELGNMYFSQGRWEEAAAAYYDAGIRLVREGRLETARELVNVIRGLNGKQADDLEKLISSAATPGGQ
jgi:hypothetical protein